MNRHSLSSPIWKHKLDIIIPDDIVDPTAMFLHVSSVSNPYPNYPISASEIPADTRRAVDFAESSGIISAVLYNVPNQPIIFDPIEGTVL